MHPRAPSAAKQVRRTHRTYPPIPGFQPSSKGKSGLDQNLGHGEGIFIRQGQVNAAIEVLKRFSHDGTADASAPGTLRVIMWQLAWHTTLEAELGRTTDIETNVAEFDRLGALAINQVGAESFVAATTQLWKEALRTNLKMATGQTAGASLRGRPEIPAPPPPSTIPSIGASGCFIPCWPGCWGLASPV